MSNYNTFEDLKNKRIKFVESARENVGMFDGIKHLLSELYPDEAHFIYELLQNAEDKKADKVKFELNYDKLVFYHNGCERDFVLDDIDAITNIGQSQKKDDPTKIGKFGVGFKAVYSYTNTPEIHSGKFDFKIRDMLIPDDEGIRKTAKEGITCFVFPFDNPSKPASLAFEEIKAGLLALDENSILFLNNIKQIHYILPNNNSGGLRTFNNDKSIFTTIIRLNPETKKSNETYWVKFSDTCKMEEDGEEKECPVSIAFKIIKLEDGENVRFKVDSELKGNVCIYFPAVKENSNLRFHINAPFASTVARDSVRNCPENKVLINAIAELTVKSLYNLKESNLLEMDMYAALPNKRDFEYNPSSIYYVIYALIIEEFKKAELLSTVSGDYKKVSDVLQANREVVKLIDSNDIYKIYKKFWIRSAEPQTREYYFLRELNIEQFDKKSIVEKLSENNTFFDTLFLNKSTEWFRNFYSLLSDDQDAYYNRFYLQNVCMVKCCDGKLHKPKDNIYLYNSEYRPVNIMNPIYVDLPKENPKANEKAKKFLEMVGIRLMCDSIDIMVDISSKPSVSDEDAIKAISQIISKVKAREDISVFKNEPVFLARRRYDGHNFIVKASECSISNEVAFFYRDLTGGEYILALDKYSNSSLSPSDVTWVKEAFKKLGGKIGPQIEPSVIHHSHPQFDKLDTSRENNSCINRDYTLTGYSVLSAIKQLGLYKESLLLWQLVVSDTENEHHRAYYRANASRDTQVIESTAAYYLSRMEWIPNKKGEFCRPCDISKDDLYDGYYYSDRAVFLKNLGFGNKQKDQDDKIRAVKNAGVNLSNYDEEWLRMSEEEKKELIEFRKIKKEKEKLSFKQALEEQNKEQITFDEEDYYDENNGIKDVNKRSEKQRRVFEEGLTEATTKKKRMWHYTYDVKKSGPEKEFVNAQYHGECQICGRKPIIKHNGDKYFEAINIIKTDSLNDKYLNNLDSGWNTLCLCPNCAAEYLYCQKNLDGLQEQIEDVHLENGDGRKIELFIILKNEKTKLSFTPKHFLALQTAFKVFSEHDSK